MGICQMSLLQIRFDIYSALNQNKLIFKHGLIWPCLWLDQSVDFDRTDDWFKVG